MSMARILRLGVVPCQHQDGLQRPARTLRGFRTSEASPTLTPRIGQAQNPYKQRTRCLSTVWSVTHQHVENSRRYSGLTRLMQRGRSLIFAQPLMASCTASARRYAQTGVTCHSKSSEHGIRLTSNSSHDLSNKNLSEQRLTGLQNDGATHEHGREDFGRLDWASSDDRAAPACKGTLSSKQSDSAGSSTA